MMHIEVDAKRIDGAWLIQKAEKLGITMPAKPSFRKSAYSQKQEMGTLVAEIERFFDPLSQSPILSHRRKLGHWIIFLKKAIRKAIKPLFSALINTQRIFNSKMLEWVRLQHQWDQRSERRLAALDKAARELNNRILKLEKALQEAEKSNSETSQQREDMS